MFRTRSAQPIWASGPRPHTQAGHMTAIDQTRPVNCTKSLQPGGRPHMGSGLRLRRPRNDSIGDVDGSRSAPQCRAAKECGSHTESRTTMAAPNLISHPGAGRDPLLLRIPAFAGMTRRACRWIKRRLMSLGGAGVLLAALLGGAPAASRVPEILAFGDSLTAGLGLPT